MDYNELFLEFLELTEFYLSKQDDGTYSLVDMQHANLGDIEGDRFTSAEAIADRMDTYIHDYLLDDEVWGQYDTCEQALRECPNHPCKPILEMLAHHINEVNLDKAYSMI